MFILCPSLTCNVTATQWALSWLKYNQYISFWMSIYWHQYVAMILWKIQSASNIQLTWKISCSGHQCVWYFGSDAAATAEGDKASEIHSLFQTMKKTKHNKISALTKSPVPLIDWKWVSSDERYTDCESGLCGFKTKNQNYLNACPCVPLMSVAKDSVSMIAHWFPALIQIIKTHELELSGRKRY